MLRTLGLPIVRYLTRRALILGATLVAAAFITVLIANMGGYVDEMIYKELKYSIESSLARSPDFAKLPPDVQRQLVDERLQAAVKARGLDQPLWVRVLRYTCESLTFSLAEPYFIRSASGSNRMLDVIMERLPWTVLLFVTGTAIAATIGVPIGLYLTRRLLSSLDKSIVITSVITYCIPPWFFGILFIYLLAVELKAFPPGGIPPYREPLSAWMSDVLYHLSLPLITWVVAFFGYWIYLARSLAVGVLGEDFVVAARARGVSDRMLMSRYILRPISPALITALALSLVFAVQGAIITETVFNWPGLGRLYYDAIIMLDAPVVVQLTVFYAYLLVVTVFILDVVYAVLDPRIRTGAT